MMRPIKLTLAAGILVLMVWSAAASASPLMGNTQLMMESSWDVPRLETSWTTDVQGMFTLNSNTDLRIDLTADVPLQGSGDTAFKLNGAYVEMFGNDITWRIGKQRIEWGSGYLFNPISVIDPRDPQDLLAKPFALWSVLAERYFGPGFAAGDGSIALVYTPAQVSPVFPGAQDSPEFAVKWTQRGLDNFDVSANIFRGSNDTPPFAPVTTYGVDTVGSLGSAGVWFEGAYHDTPDSTMKRHEIVVGTDTTFTNGMYAVGEYFNTTVVELGTSFSALVGSIRQPFGYHTGHISIMVGLGEEAGGYLINPELSFSLQSALNLKIGLYKVDVRPSSMFASLMLRNGVYSQLKYYF